MAYQEKTGLSFNYGDSKRSVNSVDYMLNIADCISH